MPSNLLLTSLIALGLLTSACTPTLDPNVDNIIGDEVNIMSSLTPSEAEQAQTLVIYDETIKYIHKFDLNKMEHKAAYQVENPDQKHYVLADALGNFIVDLTKKGFSIIRRDGTTLVNPIRLEGTPVSTAFRPSLGYLIIYDNLGSAGILKINPQGDISKSWVGGAKLESGVSIAAGDITEDGRLILALTDKSIAVVDLEQTLEQKKWVFTKFPTTLENISWVAPVPGHAEQVYVRSASTAALIDTTAQSVLQQVTLNGTVQKLSKVRDPHIIVRSSTGTSFHYVDNGVLKFETLTKAIQNNIVTSLLDIKKDRLHIVDSLRSIQFVGFEAQTADNANEFKAYRLSDMLALETKSLPEKARIQLADQFVFALLPSDLGYAVRFEIGSNLKSELRHFNVKYVRP